MWRSASILAALPLTAQAADGSSSVIGVVVLVMVGLAAWLSQPAKRRTRTGRPPRQDGPPA